MSVRKAGFQSVLTVHFSYKQLFFNLPIFYRRIHCPFLQQREVGSAIHFPGCLGHFRRNEEKPKKNVPGLARKENDLVSALFLTQAKHHHTKRKKFDWFLEYN